MRLSDEQKQAVKRRDDLVFEGYDVDEAARVVLALKPHLSVRFAQWLQRSEPCKRYGD